MLHHDIPGGFLVDVHTGAGAVANGCAVRRRQVGGVLRPFMRAAVGQGIERNRMPPKIPVTVVRDHKTGVDTGGTGLKLVSGESVQADGSGAGADQQGVAGEFGRVCGLAGRMLAIEDIAVKRSVRIEPTVGRRGTFVINHVVVEPVRFDAVPALVNDFG